MQEMVDVSASTSSPENGSKNDNSGRSIALGESASMYNEGDVNSDVREDNPDDVSCEEIIVRDDERYSNLEFFGIIDASPLFRLSSNGRGGVALFSRRNAGNPREESVS